MPVYTYECEECGVRFNMKQRFSDDAIEVCPECGGHTHKVIGPVGVVFKGSGFYITDSRSKRSNLTGGSKKTDDTPSKPAEASSDSGSSDTKTTKAAKSSD
jgi:putative FmdB family regulatory protein